MKRLFLLLYFAATWLAGFSQGILIEDTIIVHFTIPEINDIISQNGLPAGVLATDYEVDVHRVIYTTPDVDGTATIASGLICLPVNDSCGIPMLAYLHGTKILKQEAFYYLNGEWHLGVLSATTGYAVCMPDYLGLGAGPGIHPYQHAQTEASASVDILRACRTIADQKGLSLNEQLFLVGYSQGGHSVLATHRMIQEELTDEFTVTASAPGSGPYNMSGSQLDMVASFEPYAVPGYLPFLIQSYQHVYGNLYDSIQQIYVPPYDQTLPPLLDGSHGMDAVNQAMPAVPRDIVQPDYADAFFSDTTHPAYLALKANDVYQWIPEAPMMYNYCGNDEEVSYLNTIVASDYMVSNGASDIQVIERDTALGHFACATPSILFSKLWFDTMAEMCGSDVGIDGSTEANSIKPYPNPVIDGWVSLGNTNTVFISVYDSAGRILISDIPVAANERLDVSGLATGVYTVSINVNDQRTVVQLVVQ